MSETDGGSVVSGENRLRVNADGYVQVLVRGRWRMEHRVVVEGLIGRRLKRGEVVHHLNEDKSDNRPQNLLLLSGHAAHRRVHEQKAVRPVWDGRTCAVPGHARD